VTDESLEKRRPAARSSPFETILQTDSPLPRRPPIRLVTGQAGAGKTTFCSELIRRARKQGLDVAGLLTLPRLNDGQKAGFDVVDVRTGTRRRLAEAIGAADGPTTERWQFHRESLDWGTEVLLRATPCDFLLIDELGPLEILQGSGWVHAFDVLRAGEYGLAVVVVRPALVAAFESRLDAPLRQPLLLTESSRSDSERYIDSLLRVVS
jgi:nucleoside-triphosphatase